MIGIYKITSPSNKIYIGQTIDFKRRVNQYKSLMCKRQPRIYSSLKKYGFKNHKIELIEQCYITELNIKERYYQEIYNTLSKNGLNCQYVKTENKKYKHSEETKLKIGKAHRELAKKGKVRKGFKLSQEHKDKIGKSNKGNKRPDFSKIVTELNKKNKGEKSYMFGKQLSNKTKQKISNSKKNKLTGFESAVAKIVIDTGTGIFYTFKELSFILDKNIKNVKRFNQVTRKKNKQYIIL